MPVTAATAFVQSGPVTGAIHASAQVTIQITSLNAAGFNVPVGITLSSSSGFSHFGRCHRGGCPATTPKGN